MGRTSGCYIRLDRVVTLHAAVRYRAYEVHRIPDVIHRKSIAPRWHRGAVYAKEDSVIQLAIAEEELRAYIGEVTWGRVADEIGRGAFAVAGEAMTADAVSREYLLTMRQGTNGGRPGLRTCAKLAGTLGMLAQSLGTFSIVGFQRARLAAGSTPPAPISVRRLSGPHLALLRSALRLYLIKAELGLIDFG